MRRSGLLPTQFEPWNGFLKVCCCTQPEVSQNSGWISQPLFFSIILLKQSNQTPPTIPMFSHFAYKEASPGKSANASKMLGHSAASQPKKGTQTKKCKACLAKRQNKEWHHGHDVTCEESIYYNKTEADKKLIKSKRSKPVKPTFGCLRCSKGPSCHKKHDSHCPLAKKTTPPGHNSLMFPIDWIQKVR